MEFVCNICGQFNRTSEDHFDREKPGCRVCRSSLRRRGLIHLLSLELFGLPLALPEFPRLKTIRGLGLSDADAYAGPLEEKFDYRNTFYDREPRFDITHPPAGDESKYDFLIASEVFEHVMPPVEEAFRQAHRLLKPNGVFILTVPYSLDPAMKEHYPDLHEFAVASLGGRAVLVNRTRDGQMQTFDNLIFHGGGARKALELREFNETELKRALEQAGFSSVRIHSENYAPAGIEHAASWSLPIAARKGEFAFRVESAQELVEQWRYAHEISENPWKAAGRRLHRVLQRLF